MRELGKLSAILSDIGMEVTYAYDDLVFLQSSMCLLQFPADESEQPVALYLHHEFAGREVDFTMSTLQQTLTRNGINVEDKGRFALSECEHGEIRIQFMPAA